MPDWEYCSCPHCGNTLRLRPNRVEVEIPCPVCRRTVDLSGALAKETGHQRAANGDQATVPTEGEEIATPGGGESGLRVAKPVVAPDRTANQLRRAPDKVDWDPGGDEAARYVEDEGEDENEVVDEDDGDADGDKPIKVRQRRFGLWGQTPPWETTEPRKPGKDFISRYVIRAGLVLLGVLVVILVVNMFTTRGRIAKPDPNAPPVRRLVSMFGGKPAVSTVTGEVKVLHDALIANPQQLLETMIPIVEKFLRGATWKDKLVLARDAPRVGPLMERYYSRHPDKPVDFISVGADKALAYKNNLLVINVLMRDYEVRQIALEYKDGSYRVDWESFVGFCEMDPGELRDKRPVKPTMVRASISPAIPGYFNYAFTDELGLDCYLITFPDESYAFGYVEKTTPIARTLGNLLDQSNSAMAVLTVRYPEGSVVGDQCWIHQVIAEGWLTVSEHVPSNQ